MSFEYSAPVRIDQTILNAILKAISEHSRYQLIPRSPESSQVALRIVRSSPRTKWPEDISVTWKDGLHAVLYSADRSQEEPERLATR